MTFFGMAMLTAIATVVLAVFAVVTAVYARKAFREQSREVTAIEQQVKDEQEVTRQQGELLKVQTGQLELQRQQLEDQRATSARQAEVLNLQAAELRESLEVRKREAEREYRAQASRVFLTEERYAGGRGDAIVPGANPPAITAVATNASEQPIYDAEFYWHRGSAGEGNPNPEPIGTMLPRTRYEARRAFPHGSNLDACGAVLRFSDAAGTRWIRRPDGYLGEQE